MTLLADRLGHERAAIVIERAGGQRIAIPNDLSHYRTTDTLKRRFGEDIAIALVLHFGGSRVYIPRSGMGEKASVSAVVRLTKQNKSASVIARKLKCSDRTVYSRRAEARARGLLPA